MGTAQNTIGQHHGTLWESSHRFCATGRGHAPYPTDSVDAWMPCQWQVFFFACEVLHEIYGVIVLALLGGVPTTRSPDNFRQDQKIDRIKLYSGIWINSNLINQHHMFFSVCWNHLVRHLAPFGYIIDPLSQKRKSSIICSKIVLRWYKTYHLINSWFMNKMF